MSVTQAADEQLRILHARTVAAVADAVAREDSDDDDPAAPAAPAAPAGPGRSFGPAGDVSVLQVPGGGGTRAHPDRHARVAKGRRDWIS